MMRLFRQYIVGGRTGSREGAWLLVWVLVIVPLWALIVGELRGIAMPVTSGVLMVVGPAVLTLWAIAHGLEKVADRSAPGPPKAPEE